MKIRELRNESADMKIGIMHVKSKPTLYIQIGQVRQIYATVMQGKEDKLLQMIERWDEAGGADSVYESHK